MKRFALLFTLAACLAAPQAGAQNVTAIRAGAVLDVRTGEVERGVVILVRDGRIEAMGRDVDVPTGAEIVDLSGQFVLPGLMDAHVHLLVQPDYSSNNPILNKSIPYRTVEGVAAARASLMAGFTSVRDMDSEGADWADVGLRDAINDGLVPGPRLQVSTRALSITGGYMNQNGLAPQIDVPQFGVLTDSDDAIVAEIRTEVKYGTDWIKLYATGTTRHINLEDMTPLPQFDRDEIALVMKEAARFRIPVAAHAYGGPGAYDAVDLGARSIEHGMLMDDRTLDLMVEKGTFWVPTISVYMGDRPPAEWSERTIAITSAHKATFAKAVQKGVRIAYGTDIGALPHGTNAVDFEVMVAYGMSPINAIRSATIETADLMGMAGETGELAPGMMADIIAVQRNPLEDISTLSQVTFVMKGGTIYKQ
ncbi:MAG: imidazolonepropionase-like amidohydrolase [Rhodothermales bacterium]|jgi:imidazolonepropionase-like amidohydrolase